MTIDRELNFNSHMEIICKKAGQTLNALARLCRILPLNKGKVLMKNFVISQFSFSPFLGMFCGRNLNSKINYLHDRALRLVYNDNISTFDELI